MSLARHKGATLGVALFTLLAVVLTAMVAGTLSRAQHGDAITITAVFRDATGLRAGDDVRVAGVRVGRVTGTRVGTGEETGLAVVTMSVGADQVLHDDVTATIDYLNLMGQRYVALARPDAADDARRLRDGARIPLARTRPALDLTAMFNAFKPVFDLLQPGDLNQARDEHRAGPAGPGPHDPAPAGADGRVSPPASPTARTPSPGSSTTSPSCCARPMRTAPRSPAWCGAWTR
ncbi:MCE family protein [Nocardioides sp. W3-2-3]|uniref:MlaD family protein n=1 Tax=Nocardioides convexus TaxID=2712224 RepID=UPI002418A210|nr:MlaD family protein [Nocardioides convexus]NHA01788.1 MCE family protein [Nocardioides convexus]